MVVGRKVILKSKETGETIEFQSMKNADRFLLRSEGYIGNCYGNKRTAVGIDGEEFEIILEGKTKRRNQHQKYESKLSQKCLTCARAYGFCSWSDNFTPVDGWTATPTLDADGAICSYAVAECPLYEEDASTPEERKNQIRKLRRFKEEMGVFG